MSVMLPNTGLSRTPVYYVGVADIGRIHNDSERDKHEGTVYHLGKDYGLSQRVFEHFPEPV